MLASGRVEEVTGLREAFPGALLPGPLGPLTPDTAVLLPLTVSGRPDPIGVLVVGVNPYRPLNPEYRAFLTVVARQVRVALGDTVAYEVERLRSSVLADLDRAKMEFFQNVSHELRTPLTVLLAPLQNLLAVSADRPEAEQQDLQAAVRAADRLRTMVDALLDFSGAEARTLHPDRQPTDLADLTAQTCSMFRAAAEHAGLDFTVEIPDAPLTVAVDRAMWSTIVTNLVSNAVKYTTHGEHPDPAHRHRYRRGAHRRRHRRRGSPPTSRRWCSTGSTGPPTARNRAPGSGWRWWPTWSAPTTAAWTWTAPRAGAAPSPSPCRSSSPPGPPMPPAAPPQHPTSRSMGRRDHRCWWSRTTPTCGSS